MRMVKQAGSAVPPAWLPGGGSPDQGWKLSLSLAVALHAVVLVLALTSPVFFGGRPALPEIHTVNLFNAVESGPTATIAKAKQKAPAPVAELQPRKIKTMESEPIKKEAPAPPPPPKAAPTKAPAISERPLPSKTAKDEVRLREIKRELAARQAREAEQLAEQQVNIAMDSIRDLYQNEKVAAPVPAVAGPPSAAESASESAPAAAAASSPAASSPAESGSAGGGEGAIVEEVLRRYLAAVHARIQQHWTLPDLQSWDDSLEALLVIKIRKDGILLDDGFFEKRSENFYFNQFVEKAIREASPFPPFPAELKEERLEIGLRFRPGEIF